MSTPEKNRRSKNLLRLRIIRGHVLMLKTTISQYERDKKTREVLDLISELETEIAL